jgi:hypothetical protein
MAVAHGDAAAHGEDARRPRLAVDWPGWGACATAVVGFVLCLLGWMAGGGAFFVAMGAEFGLTAEFRARWPRCALWIVGPPAWVHSSSPTAPAT